MNTLTIPLAAALLGASLPCQPSVTIFGAGCPLLTTPPSQAPSIGSTGMPRIGQTFSLDYSGPNYHFTWNYVLQTAQPMLALGTQVIATPLPPLNLIYQPSTCNAYVVPVSVTPMPPHATLLQFETSFAIAIPNTPSLVGFQFIAQWLLVHSRCLWWNCVLEGLITSDAAIVTVGT